MAVIQNGGIIKYILNIMDNIKISVITVCYNSEKTIERTIQSVIQQKYDNLDYIIIDGGSTDGTMNIVNRYRSKLDYVVSEEDNGISDAFNKGILHAKGEVIGIVNSDDYLLPNALQSISDVYDKKYDLYHGCIILENPQTGFKCRERPSKSYPVMPFFRHVAHGGLYVTKDAYKKFGMYDTSIKWSMDLDFLMRAYRMKAKVCYVDKDISAFCAGGVTSDNVSKKKNEFLYIVRKNGGNWVQSHLFWWYIYFTQKIKHAFKFIGFDRMQKWRYGIYNINK